MLLRLNPTLREIALNLFDPRLEILEGESSEHRTILVGGHAKLQPFDVTVRGEFGGVGHMQVHDKSLVNRGTHGIEKGRHDICKLT